MRQAIRPIPASLHSSCNHSQLNAKLSQARCQLDVECGQAQFSSSVQIGMNRTLEQWRSDTGDRNHREQRHLQARLEQAARTHNKQAQRGKPDRVHGAALAVDEPSEQVEGDHPERSLHWRSEAGKERIRERRRMVVTVAGTRGRRRRRVIQKMHPATMAR